MSRQFSLESNFFPITVRNLKAFQFDIAFEPEPRSSVDCQRIFNIASKEAKLDFGIVCPDVPRDFKDPLRVLYTTKNPELPELLTFTDKKTKDITEITLRLAREIDGESVGHHLISIIIHRAFTKLNYVNIKEGFYTMDDIIKVDRTEVALARGFDFSIVPAGTSHDFLFCVKPEFLSLRTRTLSQEVQSLRNDRGFDLERTNQELLNKTVFLPHSNRFYKVKEIDLKVRPTDSFPTEEFPNYIEYFRNRYPEMRELFGKITGRDIFSEMERDPGMVNCFVPMKQRQHRRVRHVFTTFPLSMCLMGGQPEIPPNQRRSVTQRRQLTARESIGRSRSIIDNLIGGKNELSQNARDLLASWNVKISPEPISVQAKQFPMPMIVNGAPRPLRPDNRDGSIRRGLQERVRTMPTDMNIRIVYIGSNRGFDTVFGREGRNILIRMGFEHVGPPQKFFLRYGSEADFERAFDDCRRLPQKPSIVMVGLPNDNPQFYDRVKSIAARSGLVTQCVNLRNLERTRNRAPYLWGLFQQFVAKLGAVVWKANPTIPKLCQTPTMLMGIHFTHAPSGGRTDAGAASASLAVCSTISADFVQHFSQCKMIPRERLGAVGSELSEMMSNALEYFVRNNKRCVPARIILLRSGLPDGSVSSILENELEAIRSGIGECLKRVFPDEQRAPPVITVTVVRRRSNSRFALRGQNPIPGTFVQDPGLVQNASKDFYMITGQVPKRGSSDPPCVKPIFYSIYKHERADEVSVEDLACFLFQTAFNYVNFPGPTSLPISLRYAALLTQHVQEHSHFAPEVVVAPNSFSAKPYFI